MTKRAKFEFNTLLFGAVMKKAALALALILALLFIVVAGTQTIKSTEANPYNFPVPSMKITSLPDPPNNYENSSVSLEIEVYMLNESPKLRSIYYSLDGAPFVYLDFTTLHISSWWPDRSGYTVGATADIEHLSEGSHKVIAYSVDSNGKVMSTYRTFTVNSHYQVTVLEILSPENKTYSKNEIPLIFTINGEFKNASYGFLPPSPIGGNMTGNPITGNSIAGNTTLTGLSDGVYEILMYAYADGKGGTIAYIGFSVNSTQASYLENLENHLPISTIVAIGATLVIITGICLGILVYFKKRKH